MSTPTPAAAHTLLVIEDDEDIARALHTLLRRAGYHVVVALDGKDGLRRFHVERPDLVILDVGLPSLDGWAVLGRVREMSSTPVLMLTARDSEPDKVRGLRSGADDYLTKPFGNQELLARVEAILRRVDEAAVATSTAPSVHGPDGRSGATRAPSDPAARHLDERVWVDIASHRVEVNGSAVGLTPTEFRLLEALLRHSGQVLSSEQLLRLAWRDPTATGPDRVKFTMLRLRRKLGWSDSSEGPIETVRGFGYRLRPPTS
jgi:DNA-binding response OmpR family regulator